MRRTNKLRWSVLHNGVKILQQLYIDKYCKECWQDIPSEEDKETLSWLSDGKTKTYDPSRPNDAEELHIVNTTQGDK